MESKKNRNLDKLKLLSEGNDFDRHFRQKAPSTLTPNFRYIQDLFLLAQAALEKDLLYTA